MKKIYSILIVFVLFLLPFAAFAAVDVTLTDELDSISVSIDTQTDVISEIRLPIMYSEGVNISGVTEADLECSSLDYEILGDQNTVLVTCELDTPVALDGVLANIVFTSDGDYSFEILDNDDLDLGGLLLGQLTNVDGDIQDDVFDANQLEEGEFDNEAIGFEDDPMFVTEEAPAPMETGDSELMDTITEYLPYILIGASVILLISIAAILLTKKKGPKAPPKKTDTPDTPAPEAPAETSPPQADSTLQSMVNSVDNTSGQQQAPNPMAQPEPQQPMGQTPQPVPSQPETPPVPQTFSPGDEKDDLAEILQRESSAPPVEEPVAPTQPESQVQPIAQQPETSTDPQAFSPGDPVTPTQQESQVQPMAQQPETSMDPQTFSPGDQMSEPQPEQPEQSAEGLQIKENMEDVMPDVTQLQNQINNEANQMANQQPEQTTPVPNQTPGGTQEPVATNATPAPEQNDYPPVPPTVNQQPTSQQSTEGSENLPQVPPTM